MYLLNRAAVVFMTAVLLFTSVMVVSAAVWTDQDDYTPGSVVTVSGDNSNFAEGEGYLAGETVDVAVSGPNGWSASCSAEVSDDGTGSWSCQVTLDSDPDVAVGDYTYTATGQESGTTESGTFTDNIGVTITAATFVWKTTTDFDVAVAGTYTCNTLGAAANQCNDADDVTITVHEGDNSNNNATGTTVATKVLVVSTAGTGVEWNFTFEFRAAPSGTQYASPADGQFDIKAIFHGNLSGNARTSDPAVRDNYFGLDTTLPTSAITSVVLGSVTAAGTATDPGSTSPLPHFSGFSNSQSPKPVRIQLYDSTPTLIDEQFVEIAGLGATGQSGTWEYEYTDPLDPGGFCLYSRATDRAGNVQSPEDEECFAIVAAEDPDLTADKTNDVSGTVNLGDTFTWTVTVSNIGDGPAEFAGNELLLEDELTPGPTYDNVVVDDSNVTTGAVDCAIAADVLTCWADGGAVTMASGDDFSVDFDVEPTAAEFGTLDNPYPATESEPDGICMADPDDVVTEADEENNECSDSVTVTAPDLTAEKTNDTDPAGYAQAGVPFEWKIRVENEGDGDAAFADDEVVLLDELTPGPVYGSPTVTYSNGFAVDCDIVSDVLTCVADGAVTIEPGEYFDVSFDVTPGFDLIGQSLDNPDEGGTCAADPDNEVPEANGDGTGETNNDCADSVEVTAIIVTRGACTFDLYPNSIPTFRNIFTPDMNTSDYKLFATNPGQFFLNVATFTDGGDDVTITLPFPFVTQGAVPIKVYGDWTATEDNGKWCFEPFDLLWSQTDQVAIGVDGPYDDFNDTADIVIDVPEAFEGWLWIRIHIDYGLKGLVTGCTKADYDKADNCTFAYDEYVNNYFDIPDGLEYEFSFAGDAAGATKIDSKNEFKRINGVAGAVIASDEEPVGGTTVEIWQGTTLWKVVVTDEDGWYIAMFKYTGKATTFTVKLVELGIQKSFTLKSNAFALVNFVGDWSTFELITDSSSSSDDDSTSSGGGGKGKVKAV